jgi:hypothetical protein
MKKSKFVPAFLIFLFSFTGLYAQTTVRGTVSDAVTGEPLPFVNISIPGMSTGVTTDFDGNYALTSNDSIIRLQYVNLGYKTETRNVKPGVKQTINVKMTRDVKTLGELTVKEKKKRYKNKDNPAVELIRKVIDHKRMNRKEEIDAYQYEKYEKVQFALSNITEKFKKRKYMRKFQFIFDNLDTTKLPGKEILPMYLSETMSEYYYRQSPKSVKEIVSATRKVDFDNFIDNEGVAQFITYLYNDINIYDNNITVLTSQFISPIADAGPLFYRYYIVDTVMVDDVKCYKMAFYPRSKSDLQFQGELYITFDTNYVVKKDEMTVNADINLNFVKDLRIVQNFDKVEEGGWLLSKDEISMDFGLSKKGMGIFGQRTVSSKNFVLNQPKPDDFYKGEDKVLEDSATMRSDNYWDKVRHSELTRSEKSVMIMVDSIQSIPAFKRFMNIMVLLFAGYKDFGDIEIGPVNTFYSYNPIEGVRVRFGGRTTRKFNPRVCFETYVVYGFTDERWKYYFGTTYALGKKSFNEFPLHNFKISYQQETKIPGQELQFVQEDNLLLSIKRGENNKLLYNKILGLDYLHEYVNHFSWELQFNYLNQAPAGVLIFNPVSYYENPATNVESITTSEFGLTLRYAPGEQFYQGRNFRIPMFNKYPVMQVKYFMGVKDLFKGEYNYNKIIVDVFKRFYVSPFGFTDVLLEGGQVFGHVPYPLLAIHRANQTYSLQLASYNLMNFLEFVSDRFVALNIDHFFNGFFFNKIPVFNRLKLREVITGKIIYGIVSDNNNPDYHDDLFKFPVNPDGTPLTYSLDKRPYIEVSAGISNILKIFRVEVIKRLTYLDHPVVSEYGIRARFKLDF